MKKIVMLILVMAIHTVSAGEDRGLSFLIHDGTYFGDKCFLKVETKKDITHIQFAHKDFLISDDNDLAVILGQRRSDIIVSGGVYNPDVAFIPENIPGINVILDNKFNWVEFGPACW